MKQRGKEDDDKRGFCRWFFRFVVVKLMASHKEGSSVTKKLIKNESKSDITIYFKQREDSEDNANPININTSGSEKERVIMLVNGNNGSKKSISSEPSIRRSHNGADKSQPKPLLNDINRKSHAFIESRLEKMRKGL
ncbi:PREDICTED: uncharacterized protein LOC104788637 [Camelina sativa]|uniref:Uncharacterized protein LOC104788637 n=1 Tax=Camelina sativa TaxID=90675 RepID=A0ABM0ZAE1_CAMSA|nr:PREDICTED: uncharacterized protein LOC104788637 [Camelina sativa]